MPRGEGAPGEDLIARCVARLARSKVPAGIFALPNLQRNSAGKVLKAELAALLTPRPARRGSG